MQHTHANTHIQSFKGKEEDSLSLKKLCKHMMLNIKQLYHRNWTTRDSEMTRWSNLRAVVPIVACLKMPQLVLLYYRVRSSEAQSAASLKHITSSGSKSSAVPESNMVLCRALTLIMSPPPGVVEALPSRISPTLQSNTQPHIQYCLEGWTMLLRYATLSIFLLFKAFIIVRHFIEDFLMISYQCVVV